MKTRSIVIVCLLAMLTACGNKTKDENVTPQDTITTNDSVMSNETVSNSDAVVANAPTEEELSAQAWEGEYEFGDYVCGYDSGSTITLHHISGNSFSGQMDASNRHEDYVYKLTATLTGNTMRIRQISGTYEGYDMDYNEQTGEDIENDYSGKFSKSDLKTLTLTKRGSSYTISCNGEHGSMKKI